MSQEGKLLRALDFTARNKKVSVYEIKDAPYVIVKCTHDYDLVTFFLLFLNK